MESKRENTLSHVRKTSTSYPVRNLLRETRNKVNSLILDEEVTCVIDAEDQLIRMSNSLCNFTTELSGIVGVIFSDRADEAIGEALKLNM